MISSKCKFKKLEIWTIENNKKSINLKAILLLFGMLIGHVSEQLPNTYITLQKTKDNFNFLQYY